MYPLKMIEIVKMFYKNNTYSIRDVANIFKIGKSTIHRWISGVKIELKEKSKKENITCVIKNEIKNEIKTNPFLTIFELTKIINSKCKVNISKSGIYIHMKSLNLVFKKTKKMICKNEQEIKEKQKKFKKDIKKIKLKDIICLDETGIYSNIHNNYGWIEKGKQLTQYIKPNPIKYSALVAINNKGVMNKKIVKGNINGKIYYDYLKNDLLSNITGKYILCDNVSFHKSEKVVNLIKETKNYPLFIPPYSPDLNPIENVFSMFKSKLQKKEHINEEIISNTFEKINQKFGKIYKHSLR